MIETFVKTYGDRRYLHTALLRHKGVLVAFALDDQRRMLYSVLDPTLSTRDAEGWFDRGKELAFPGELADVGYGVVDQLRLPTVRAGGAPVPPNTPVRADEIDSYLSSTARLTADAPFQVLADGEHVYVLRQSVAASEQDRIVTVDGPNGAQVPVVDSTLLVDRFVLAGSELRPTREVRYQRSRSKTRPQSAQDTLGAADLDGNPFVEPTQALRFVTGLTEGRFSALLLPTSVAEVSRWQIFADNVRSSVIDAFSVERSADGLFNTRGTQFYTCVDHPAVFSLNPGQCPEPGLASPEQTCGKDLVPATSTGGYAGAALRFGRDGAVIENHTGIDLGPAFTVEMWLNVADDMYDGERLLIGGETDPTKSGPTMFIAQGTRLRVGFGDGAQFADTTTGDILSPGAWNHLAVSFDGRYVRVYVDGVLRHRTDALAGRTPPASPITRIGSTDGNGFRGTIDEIRFWNVVRAARDIRGSMHQRLNGLEPGLAAYLRLDEGSGDGIWDLTGRHGLFGDTTGTDWVGSGAPIGDTPGISRFSFRVAGRLTTAGMASLLYYQQEKVAAGYDTATAKPLKRNARVMIAVPTYDGNPDRRSNIAVFDLGVGIDGKIAQIPAEAQLTTVDVSGGAGISLDDLLNQVAQLESEASRLRGTIADNQAQLASADSQVQLLRAALDPARSTPPPGLPPDVASQVNLLYAQRSAVAAAEAAVTDIPNAVLRAYAIAYQDWNYGGRFINLHPGFHDQDELTQLGFNDQISSFTVPAELQLTVYADQHRGGRSQTFYENTPSLGGGWNDTISSIDVGENVNLRPYRNALLHSARTALENTQIDLTDRLVTVAQQVNDCTAAIQAAGAQLAGVEAHLRQASDALSGERTATMPLISVDAAGHSVTGAVLGWAWTTESPTLFDSALGRVSLYFRGAAGDFFVTHYDTSTERAKFSLATRGGQGVVTLAARSPGISGAEGPSPLTVALASDGEATATLTLILRTAGSTVQETWKQVPLEPSAFADVLNGRAAQRTYVGEAAVVAGTVSEIRLTGATRLALEEGSLLAVGATTFAVAQHADAGATAISVRPASIILTAATPVYQFGYDYAAGASSTLVAADLFRGSQLVVANAAGASGTLVTDAPTLIPAAVSSRWFADAPGSALDLDGHTSVARGTADAFAAAGDLTVESWIRPTGTANLGRIVQQRSDSSTYQLGLQLQPYSAVGLLGTWFEVPATPALEIQGRITIETWVRADDISGLRSIVARGPAGNAEVALRNNGGVWQVGSFDGSDHFASAPPHPEDKEVWVHVAGVYDGTAWTIYRNGIPEQTTPDPVGAVAVGTGWTIGAAVNGTRPLFGAMDEVRIWNRDRGREEIVADMHRRLTGVESGLAGLWHWAGGSITPAGLVIHGTATPLTPPMPTYRAVAGVAGQIVQSRDFVPGSTWSHLAVTFAQSYGVHTGGGGAHLDCGGGDTLNLSADLTIDVGVTLDDTSGPHGLVSRGVLAPDGGDDAPYNLSADIGGTIVFAYKDNDGTIQSVASGPLLTAGSFHRVTVTRKHGTDVTKPADLAKVDVKTIVKSWDDIVIYLDGTEVARRNETRPRMGGSADSTRIGRSWLADGRRADLRGALAEVRLWSVARDPAAVNTVVTGTEPGLVAWWRFDENAGSTAQDTKSRTVARFQGDVRWVRSPDPRGSALVLYLNGSPATTAPAPATYAVAAPQFTVGDSVQGQLEELRIWRSTRTPEQIQDSLFRRLTGEQEDLIAYYTFDPDTPSVISDHGLRGNHLIAADTKLLLSTAPISEDEPEVRNALLQVRTEFNGTLDGRPAVAEYADLQSDATNQAIGVFKRCYVSVRDGRWRLVTGFKVGDMTAEWVGQVQFAPQLIGYIEGAPPVPAENLTVADDYSGASSVALTEARTTTYTYASDRNTGFDAALEATAKVGADAEVSVGVGVETKALKVTGAVGLKTTFETTQGWTDNATAGQGRVTTRVSTLGLRGRKDGDRWRPDNVGFALVQSDTADVFALRLAHTGALIAYEMRPNPDIPKDWNIITFPLNRFYTKQGTLDGKVGLDADADYPNAGAYSPDRSYFKPIEAYGLKNRIQREEAQLRTLFDQFDAGGAGRRTSSVNFSGSDLAAGRMIDQFPKLEKRNLVNTYVWTADGGQFAEEEQNLDTRTETTGGSYTFKGMAGIVGELEIEAGVTVSAELSALFGGHLNLTVTKAVNSDTSFGVSVSVTPESDIFGLDDTGQVARTPGKVDAYRFLTFYLEPEVENFDRFFNQVVDPIWLDKQDSPEAAALAGARQTSSRPPCWRIMHRVTYVSRVLAKTADQPATATPLEKALVDLDIASNYQLIKTLEPFVRDRAGNYADFGRAVRAAVANYLPDLQPHVDEIVEFLVRYYGVTDSPALSPAEADDTSKLAAEPPAVHASATARVAVAEAAELSGTVLDEVLDPEAIPVSWTAVTGPGLVTIAAPNALTTTARFAEPGTYVLRLTATGRLAAHADTTVAVTG